MLGIVYHRIDSFHAVEAAGGFPNCSMNKIRKGGRFMNIGILEYDKNISRELKEIVSHECPQVNMVVWEREEEMKQSMTDGPVYKILFLSLEENPREIIAYSKRLQDLNPDLKIIYLSELNETIFEVFEAAPTYVLSKPLNEEYVRQAIQKALRELAVTGDKLFTIINKQGIFTIPYDEIYYVESDKRKLNIYGEEGLVRSINLKISDFLTYEHGDSFLQCHKSYAVNLKHISQLEKYQIVLKNGATLPISQSRYTETKAGYVEYLENE